MNPYHRKALVSSGLLLILLAADASGQAPLGSIYRMVEQKRGHEVTTTEHAVIADSVVTHLRRAEKGGALFYKNLVQLDRGLRLDLRVNRSDVESRHVLAADAGRVETPEAGWLNVALGQRGIYELREDPRRLRGLEFWHKRG